MAAADGASDAIAQADRGVADLLRLRASLLADIRRLVLTLDTAPGGDRLTRDAAALANSARVVRQIEEALTGKGLPLVADVIVDRAQRAIAAVVPSDFAPNAWPEVQAILSGQTAEVASVFASAADEMRIAINEGTTRGGSLDAVLSAVAERLDVTLSKAASAVDAAIMASGRRAVVAAAKETGLDLVYLYVGPDDGKNRDFCKALVGKAVTPSLFARLNNGQNLPAADFCGGYNCRHSWAPLPLDEAKGITVLS